jgi:hypothetical protein
MGKARVPIREAARQARMPMGLFNPYPFQDRQGERIPSSTIQGIGGTTGKALALSIIGATVYGVIKLVDLVTD